MNRFAAEDGPGAVAHSHTAVAVAPRSGNQGKDPVCTWQLVSWHLERIRQVLSPRSRAGAAPSARRHVRMVLVGVGAAVLGFRRTGWHIRPPGPSRPPRPEIHRPSGMTCLPPSPSHGACTCARDPCPHRPGWRA